MATAQVSSESSFGFPAKGSLRRVPFARLIREVAQRKLDGSLYLLSGQTKKVVFFEQGKPVFVRSNVLSECLGQILAKEGLITQEQCEQTLEAIRRTGKKQGELLVEMGILSEGNLRYGLEAQLRAKLFEIFSWEGGRYQFKPDTPGMNFGVTLRASAEGVIVEAIVDQYTEDRAGEALQDVGGKFPAAANDSAAAANSSLLPEEAHFLACLDGSRSVTDVLQDKAEPPVPTPQALMYGLWVSGLVELDDSARPAAEAPPAPDLAPGGGTDDELRPSFPAQAALTEYEDTPLPGQLPQSPGLLGDHEDGFEGVGEDSAMMHVGNLTGRTDMPESLVAAEPATIDETFDAEQLDLDSDADLDVDFDLDADEFDDDAVALPDALPDPVGAGPAQPAAVPSPISPTGTAPGSDPAPPATIAPPASEPEPAPPAAVAQTTAGSGGDTDLLDLSPDDDLMMADEGLEAMALDLVGEAGEPGAPQAPDLDNIESIEPVALDDSSFDPNEMVDDDDAEPLDDDIEVLEVSPDDLDFADDDDEPAEAAPTRDDAPAISPDDSLVGLEDLDAIDLGGDDSESEPADVMGAVHFNEGETAMAEQRWADAIGRFDAAYNEGFDVAELHAMVAFARFRTADGDAQTIAHVFELLDYAQQMDPSLDLVYAYRGAIHHEQGDTPKARKAIDRALELNPYCELAMDIQDQLA